jgi:hypothetical protein
MKVGKVPVDWQPGRTHATAPADGNKAIRHLDAAGNPIKYKTARSAIQLENSITNMVEKSFQ